MTFKIRESTAIKCVNPKEVHRKKEKVNSITNLVMTRIAL